jgi:hypothetical protein
VNCIGPGSRITKLATLARVQQVRHKLTSSIFTPVD